MDPDPGNNATYYSSGFTIGDPYYRTEVGAHENSGSPYGTFDQGGNVTEWNEASYGSERGHRGGDFISSDGHWAMRSDSKYSENPTHEDYDLGFRVAVIPEPGIIGSCIFILLAGTLARRGWRRFFI